MTDPVRRLTDAAHEALWGCHVAALFVGVGFLLRSAAWNGLGALWLCYGTPLWVLYLVEGGELLPTSLGTHVGAFALALYGVKALGPPRGVWWKAALATVALQLLTHLVAPPEGNVNLAFAVQPGWEETFPSYALYEAVLLTGAALVYAAGELTLRRLLPGRSEPDGRSSGERV